MNNFPFLGTNSFLLLLLKWPFLPFCPSIPAPLFSSSLALRQKCQEPSTKLYRPSLPIRGTITLPYFLPLLLPKHLLLSTADNENLGGWQQVSGKIPYNRLCFHAATCTQIHQCAIPLPSCALEHPFLKPRGEKKAAQRSGWKISHQMLASTWGFILSNNSYFWDGKTDVHVQYNYKRLKSQRIGEIQVRKHLKRSFEKGSMPQTFFSDTHLIC